MPIYRITLRDPHGSTVPKGTTLRVVCPSSTLSLYYIPFALRKIGVYEEEIEKLRDTTLWSWEMESDDPSLTNQLSTELRKYSTPVAGSKKDVGSREDLKSRAKEKDSDDEKDHGICIKLLFTIIPILPIWWIIKLPFALITYPFRAMFSCKNRNLLPAYSFKKF